MGQRYAVLDMMKSIGISAMSDYKALGMKHPYNYTDSYIIKMHILLFILLFFFINTILFTKQ